MSFCPPTMGVVVPPNPLRPHPVNRDPGTPRAGVFCYVAVAVIFMRATNRRPRAPL
jgi:hypothetical protein